MLLLVNNCAGTATTSWQHEVHILCSMPRVKPMQQGEPHPSACTAVQMRQAARQAARATCRDHLKIIPPTRLLPRGPRSTSGWPWLHAHALRSPLCSAKAAELGGPPGELPIAEFCPLPDRSLSVYDDPAPDRPSQQPLNRALTRHISCTVCNDEWSKCTLVCQVAGTGSSLKDCDHCNTTAIALPSDRQRQTTNWCM